MRSPPSFSGSAPLPFSWAEWGSPTSWSSPFSSGGPKSAFVGPSGQRSGVGGVALGALATAFYANFKGWDILIPTPAWTGGLAAALLIGAVAGLYPAVRAARMSPTEALRTG